VSAGGEGCFGDAESYAGGASNYEDVFVGKPLVFWGCHYKIIGVGNESCMILWYEIRIRERMDKYIGTGYFDLPPGYFDLRVPTFGSAPNNFAPQ